MSRAQLPIVPVPITISNLPAPEPTLISVSGTTTNKSFETIAYQDYGFLSHSSASWASSFATGLEAEFREQEKIQPVNPHIMSVNNKGFTVQHRAHMVNALVSFLLLLPC